MWLWEAQLRELGFKRKSERYWQCEKRYGLPENRHISLFSWSEQSLPGKRFLVELTEFHVTFEIGLENIHFYYHEYSENVWTPGGHTSFTEIERVKIVALELRAEADEIAHEFITLLRGELGERDSWDEQASG